MASMLPAATPGSKAVIALKKQVTHLSFEAETGWLKSSATKKGSTTIQSYDYDFDDTGNVTGRELSYGVGSNGDLKETFGYDDLHRLTSRTVTAAVGFSGSLSMSEAYTYDKLGNLKTKTGVGIYNFAYDKNGEKSCDTHLIRCMTPVDHVTPT